MAPHGPRIGRPDRLALLQDGDRRVPGLVQRSVLLGAQGPAPTVAEQLRELPAALDDLAPRLSRIVHRIRAARRGRPRLGELAGAPRDPDEEAEDEALRALGALRDRAWRLCVAVGQGDSVQTSARPGGGP